MACVRCPKTRCHVDKDGKATWGCSKCLVFGNKKVYSGKKFWREDEYATKDQIAEANHNFEARVKHRVADQYKHMRPSARKALFGE